jgi:MFS family permease
MVERIDPPRGVLRDSQFLRFWASETVSLLSTELMTLVFPLIAIYTFSATTFQVGLVQACLYAPVILFSLLIGVWLDRRRRRTTLILSNAVRGLLITLIPVAKLTSLLSLPMLYAIVFLVGTLTVMFEVGSLSYLPSLVARHHLADANSRIQASFSLAAIAGPSLGGVLVGALSAPLAVPVSAVGFMLSAIFLSTIRKEEPLPQRDPARPSIAASIAEGLRAVIANSLLRHLITQSTTFNLVQNGLLVVFVVYVVRHLGLRPAQLGLVLGAAAVAALLGALTTNRITRALNLGRTLRLAAFGSCVPPLLILIPRDNSVGAIALLIAAQALVSFNLVVWNVNTLTLRQVVTPHRLLGRVNASYRMVLYGAAPVGAVLGGALGDLLGLRAAMVTAALVMLVPIAWTFFSPVFRLSEMPSGPDELSAVAT